MLQMVNCHIQEDRISFIEGITVTITHYQLPPKSGLFPSVSYSRASPLSESPLFSLSPSPNSSSKTIAHLPPPKSFLSPAVAQSPATSKSISLQPSDDIKVYGGEPLPQGAKLFLHIEMPFSSSNKWIHSSSLQFECVYELRKGKQTQEMVSSILYWLQSIHLALYDDVVLVQQKLSEAINATLSQVRVSNGEEGKVVKKSKDGRWDHVVMMCRHLCGIERGGEE